MKWSITAWNGSLPGTVLVFCHIVFYSQKREKKGGRRTKREEKIQLTVKKQVGRIEISLSFIIYF